MIPLLEIEGTWTEIAAQIPDFKEQRLHVIVLPAEESQPEKQPKQTLSERFAAIRATNPEAWEQLPADLAEQHDHYLYGWPKKQ